MATAISKASCSTATATEGSQKLRAARESLAAAGMPVPAVEAMARYDWVARMLDGVVRRPNDHQPTTSDRIDAVLTHKFWGTLIFVAVMAVLFSSIFILAVPLMDADRRRGRLRSAAFVKRRMAEGALRSLVVDGVIGGVGAVVIFLPQILILFFFIALLEDCGYMARAAFLMDRLMAGVGLSGKSFIPLLSSFACAVPGIMATRVIENRRDRLATILIAPLMSCSARLPVYVILIGAFVPAQYYLGGLVGLQGLVLLAMYVVGVIVAIGVAWLLKKTLLRGETPPFVMELPSYKMPSLRTVVFRMAERGWAFLARAGTVIFAVTIVVWALAYYPRSEERVAADIAAQRADVAERCRRARRVRRSGKPRPPRGQPASAIQLPGPGRPVDRAGRAAARLGLADRLRGDRLVPGPRSGDGRAGRDLPAGPRRRRRRRRRPEPAAGPAPRRPLGRHGRAGVQFTGGPVDHGVLRPVRQCAATLAVIRRETNSWRWPAFTFVYMTALAYVGALVTYQIGIRSCDFLHRTASDISMQDILAILIVALAAAFLVRRGWQTIAQRAAAHVAHVSNCPSSSSANHRRW